MLTESAPKITNQHQHYRLRFEQIRNQTEKLCKPLQTEDYVVQPVVDVSPPKWHLAHSTWFFEQFVLVPYSHDYKVFDEDFAFLFNSYYESIGKRVLRTNRGNITRPGVAEIYAYRSYVNAAVVQLLQQQTHFPEVFWQVLELGLQHEQQHQELLVTDIKYILGNNPLFPPLFQTETARVLSENQNNKAAYLTVPAGVYTIGYEGEDFCFDNELGTHQVYLHKFEIANSLVTNAEYLEFIEAGGYTDALLWLAEGFDFIKQQQLTAPLYWHLIEGKWHYYTLQGLQKVDLTAPVTHISYYEADAFANWKNMRLPTEFEWEVASKLNDGSTSLTQQNFSESGELQPVAGLQGFSSGNCWQWTSSAYLPYPFYKKAPGALGEYNGKFMVNQMVLKGGSCATPKSHYRHTYRNFFHPHLRWQFTGIRLARHL